MLSHRKRFTLLHGAARPSLRGIGGAALVPALAVLLVLGAAAVPAAAQEDGEELDLFSGEIVIGFRSVDVDGADRKFREDVNLDDGPRLFNLSFDWTPTEESVRAFVDQVELDINNFGGDPFETLRLDVRNAGSYDFHFDRRVSEYFYDDIILPPALASLNGSTGGDFHTFDFERVHDRARLDLDLTDRADLYFGFDRFTKVGEGTTTIDIQRDEFEFDRIIDESSNEYIAGFEYSWARSTIILEERVRDYENLVDIFLPGFSLGENATDAATLDFFFLDQPYDFTSFSHTVRWVGRPLDRLTIRASATLEDLDLDLEADERQQGVTFRGAPFSSEAQGEGDIDRDAELYDVDLSYQVTDRVAVIGGVRRHELDQEGEFLFDEVLNEGTWDIETTGARGGVEVAVSTELTVSGGLSWENRDVRSGLAAEGNPLTFGEDEETERTGWFLTAGWRPGERTRVTVSLEDDSIDDPFTLASPTDRQRYRLRGSYRLSEAFSVAGTYLRHEIENSNSGWDAEDEQWNLRLDYNRGPLTGSLGYSTIDIGREILQSVRGGSRTAVFDIDYRADASFLDGRIRYRPRPGGWAVGADLRFYENDGSFGLERDDLRALVEIPFDEYVFGVGYRILDYDEDRFDFDDYEADVLELSVGYRW